MMKEEFTYLCESCGQTYPIEKDRMLCSHCREADLRGKPLRGILKVQLPRSLHNSVRGIGTMDIMDYLPVEREYFPSIPVGNTPLVRGVRIQDDIGLGEIYLKFDGANPTGSLKDRASYLVSAFAKKHRISNIVVASTGNAASSMAGVAASAGQKALIFMPSTAPKAKLVQCLQYGATLIPIKGDYDAAFDLSLAYSEKTGHLSRNTAFNPLTIEGKKTVSFEIARQMDGKEIDCVFLPVGDGVILSGVIKGFLDLLYIGAIKKCPKIIGVQASGSSFIYSAFHNNTFDLSYKANTIADSISVNAARNGYTAVADVKKVGGDIIIVTDDEILEAQKYLSKSSGLFAEPSSAAAVAGLLKAQKTIPRDKSIVVIITGHGLKDVDTAMKGLVFPQTFEPDLDSIMKALR